jgi:serine phosphatase RsbU (regulator of sigma subunit)
MDDMLRGLPLFAVVDSATRRQLAVSLPQRRFPAGTLLFREGDYGDRLYVLLEGEIAVYKAHGTPDEVFLASRTAGQFIGELSMLYVDGRRAASAIVRQDVWALEFSRAEFDALLASQPALAFELLRHVSDRLREANDTAIREMRDKNARLARALLDLQYAQERLIDQERLAHEMQLAREIQQSMLPTVLPSSPEFDIGARIVPAREVGGDFYDVFLVDLQTIGVIVGDVCGKGVPAALYMAQVRSLMRAEAARGGTAEETLRRVNAHLLSLSTAEGMFVTTIYGLLSRVEHELVAVRAGHEPLLGWNADRTRLMVRHGLGHPLGILAEPALDVVRVALPPGATLLLYTDGVSEAGAPDGSFFGRERVIDVVRAMGDVDAQQLCDQLAAELDAFRGEAEQADDITMVAIRAR